MIIKGILKRIKFVNEYVNNSKLKKSFLNDYLLYKNNYMYSHEDTESLGYNILLIVHTTEKAMSNKKPRIFGKDKMNKLISLLDKYEKYGDKNDYYYLMGISCLYKYIQFFELHNWQKTEEYENVKNYIDHQKVSKDLLLNVGNTVIKKSDMIDNKIDYYSFLKSRHSIRNYSEVELKEEDINKAIDMVTYTPSACNRQMCKIYYVKSNNKREKVINYANGFGNFELNNVNIFLVTYDVRSLSMAGERNQGWLNSGLIAMNFVNALHSLGIGSCLLQSSNTYKEEQELKKELGISDSERIAVIISAGYYGDSSIIANSVRKGKNQIYKKI